MEKLVILIKYHGKIPWKNMWYGQLKIINTITTNYDFIINIRLDYFTRMKLIVL